MDFDHNWVPVARAAVAPYVWFACDCCANKREACQQSWDALAPAIEPELMPESDPEPETNLIPEPNEPEFPVLPNEEDVTEA